MGQEIRSKWLLLPPVFLAHFFGKQTIPGEEEEEEEEEGRIRDDIDSISPLPPLLLIICPVLSQSTLIRVPFCLSHASPPAPAVPVSLDLLASVNRFPSCIWGPMAFTELQ